jgi:hypothetical protein
MVGFHSFCDADASAVLPTWKVRAFRVTVVSVLPLAAVEELRQSLLEMRVMTAEACEVGQNGAIGIWQLTVSPVVQSATDALAERVQLQTR